VLEIFTSILPNVAQPCLKRILFFPYWFRIKRRYWAVFYEWNEM